MAHLHRSLAALRIQGEDLDPSEISTLLGCAPSTRQRKGDLFTNKTTGSSRTARYGPGTWTLWIGNQRISMAKSPRCSASSPLIWRCGRQLRRARRLIFFAASSCSERTKVLRFQSDR
jgi:hypothetical protein